jgi:PTH2 family peptidyl-tRNA hydrolase
MKDPRAAQNFGPEEPREEDPIVMYLIVNETLGMSIGKTAAQTAHAAQYLMVQYYVLKEESAFLVKRIQSETDETFIRALQTSYADKGRKISIVGEWLKVGVRKVVLKANAKEWKKIKEECKDQMVLVVDAGLTQIPSGSETCIGLWPQLKSKTTKIIKRLQVL